MKKILLLVLVLFVFSFALEMKGVIVNELTIADANQNGVIKFGKSRLTLTQKTEGGSSFVYIINPMASAAADTADYLWVDTPLLGGTLRIGKQRLGLANYGGGVYQTNTIVKVGVMKDTGVSYATKFYDVKTKVFVTGGSDTDVNRKVGVHAKTKVYGINLGVAGMFARVGEALTVPADNRKTEGMAVRVDADTMLYGFKVAGTYYAELSDDAAVALSPPAAYPFYSAAGKQRTIGGLFVSTKLETFGFKYGLYADLVAQIAKNYGTISETSFGGCLDVNEDAKLFVEFILTETSKNNDKNESSRKAIVNLQIKI